MTQQFEYTFDDADNLLNSLSSTANPNDINFYEDVDSGSNDFSPGSQLSSFSNADEPWENTFPFDEKANDNVNLSANGQNIKAPADQMNVNDFNKDFPNLKYEIDDKYFNFSGGDKTADGNGLDAKQVYVKEEPYTTPNSMSTAPSNNKFDVNARNDSSASTSDSATNPSMNGETSSVSPTSMNDLLSNGPSANTANMIQKEYLKNAASINEAVKGESSTSISKISGPKSKVVKPKKGRTSHNMVEKKYRTNINSKIVALRDAVPSLRIAAHGATDDTMKDLDGLTPASKLNKASVLTKATEYILHLEKKNKKLAKENQELKNIFSQLGNRNVNQNNNNNNSSVNNNGGNKNDMDRNQQFFFDNSPQGMHNFQPPPSLHQPPHQQYNGQYFNQMPPQPSQQTQQPQDGYGMSMPMRLAMGGMTALAGSQLFDNNNSDFRGLSAFPFMQTPMFLKLFQLTKFSIILYSVFIVFEPLLKFKKKYGKEKVASAKSAMISEGSFDEHTTHSPTAWVSLLVDVLKIRLLQFEPLIGNVNEIESSVSEINREFFVSDRSKSVRGLLYMYLQLLKFNELADVRLCFLQLFFAKTLVSSSLIFQPIRLITNEKLLIEKIHRAKGQDATYKSLVEDLNHLLKSNDLFQRLVNVYFNSKRNLNDNVKIARNESSYTDIVDDIVVNSDIIKFARNLRANELLRESLVEFLAYQVYEVDEESEDFSVQELLGRLQAIEKLAVDESIINLRVKLFISLLDQSKTKETVKIVQRIVHEVKNTNEMNSHTISVKSHFGTMASVKEDDELTEVNTDSQIEDDIESITDSSADSVTSSKSGSESDLTDDEQEIDDNKSERDTIEGSDIKSDTENETETETDSASSLSKDDDDSVKAVGKGKDIGLKKLSRANAKLSSKQLISGEVFISLTSSLIIKYLKGKHFHQAASLLKHLVNYRNVYLFKTEKQITLLSFISILTVLIEFDKSLNPQNGDGAEESKEKKFKNFEALGKHLIAMENLIATLRYWIGTESQITKNINELNPLFRAEICDKLVTMGVKFSGIETES